MIYAILAHCPFLKSTTPHPHPRLAGGWMLGSDLQRRKAVSRDLSLGMVKLPGSSTFRAEAGRQISLFSFFCFLSLFHQQERTSEEVNGEGMGGLAEPIRGGERSALVFSSLLSASHPTHTWAPLSKHTPNTTRRYENKRCVYQPVSLLTVSSFTWPHHIRQSWQSPRSSASGLCVSGPFQRRSTDY